MRIVGVKDLKSNMELAKPIYYNGNIIINNPVSNLYLYKEELLSLGINYIYIKDKTFRTPLDDFVKDKTQKKAKYFLDNILNCISINDEIRGNYIKNNIYDIMEQTLDLKIVLENLGEIYKFDLYTFQHSINVAVLSVLIALLLNRNQKELENIALGSILHDLGKIFLPKEIIKKPGKLTNEEYLLIKEHPGLGYNYLNEIDDISRSSMIIIISHHENLDGSGYPDGISGKKLHLYTRISAIADVFDALSSDRIYHKGLPLKDVLNHFVSNKKYDQALSTLFINNVEINSTEWENIT